MAEKGNSGNRNDPRVQRTRMLIKSTFKAMVCEMDASNITVQKLTDRANINRKTFYLHYKCLEDLYNEEIRRICQGYCDALNMFDPQPIPVDAIKAFFEYFTKLDIFEERLLCSRSYFPYANKVLLSSVGLTRHYLGFKTYLPEDDEKVMDHFVVRNLFDMYCHWVLNGKKVPVERLIELANKHLCYGLDSFRFDSDIQPETQGEFEEVSISDSSRFL